MSAGSFDTSEDGSKRRIAHKSAGSSAELFRTLTYKRESLGKLLNGDCSAKVQSTPKKEFFSIFAKRSKMNSESDNEKSTKKKRAPPPTTKTFCGKSFMSAVTSQILHQKESRLVIKSDSEDSDPGWISKKKVLNGTSTKTGIPLPSKPPSTNYKVKRRAVLSSSEEDDDKVIMVSRLSDESNDSDDGLPKVNKQSKNNRSLAKSKQSNRKRGIAQKVDFSTESEEYEESETDSDEVDEEEEVVDTPGSSELSSEEDDLNPKKSLKQLTEKAKKLHAYRKRHGVEVGDMQLGSDDDVGDDNANDSDDIIDSEDSDAEERQSKKSIQKRKALEGICLDFINTATEEELQRTEKFNDRLTKLIFDKRPFRNYSELVDECGSIARGVAMMDQYLGFLENRSVLDQVLDDCKMQSEQISAELKRLESSESLNAQPSLLSSNCVLHSYQQVGLQWLIMMHKLGLNAILADEMGLGKTIQIIAFLAWAKEQPRMSHPHLVVVPSSTLENWMNEIAKWCPTLRVLTYYGTIPERHELQHRASTRNVDVILTTYNMVISRAEDRSFFKKFSINYVIYDEGHMLRSCNTMRYKNLMRVQGRRKILLTGTPLQNNLVELISLLFFTMTKLFTKYCNDITMLLQMFARKGASLHSGKRRNAQTMIQKGKNAAVENDEEENDENDCDDKNAIDGPFYERHKITQAKAILHPFVLRRLKTKVLNSLPKKYEHIEMCDITETQELLYTEIFSEFKEAKQLGQANALGSLMQMRQVANHPLLYRRNYDDYKVREMAKILCSKESKYKGKNPQYVAEELAYMSDISIHLLCRKFSSIQHFELNNDLSLDSGKCKQLDLLLPKVFKKGEKVLIFSQFTTILDILGLYAENRGYKFCRLDGSTPVMERQDLINLFNTDSSIGIFFLSTKAGGLGINLTAANNIIIHDIDLNPYNDKQAEDRCHRMGQTREVYVTRLISKNTVEESILELAQKKLELEKDVTSSNSANQQENLDAKTVEEILMKVVMRNKN